ncbi:response regulator [uncultured Roseobacter sp.]|uniref:response regulator n=1 Tax=uncultured Roseobacter sp. TaxID=114847 RepID=UPI00261D0EBE|nr:response regulator [uncultured Roseobacter sp.]
MNTTNAELTSGGETKRVLIMDDDLELSFDLARQLREYGFDVDTVTNASDAIAHFKNRNYTAVVTDMIIKSENRSLPDGGLSLIHRLRRMQQDDPQKAACVIIGMSGVTKYPGMQNILTTAESLGADATMKKPVSSALLVSTIEELL